MAVTARDPASRPHDGSRTRVKARVAFPTLEEQEEIPTPTRRFTVWETTSGLPDDSREEDERREERRLRDLRGRVKRARAVAASTPGLAETLAGNWRKAASFYARCGITEQMFRSGLPSDSLPTHYELSFDLRDIPVPHSIEQGPIPVTVRDSSHLPLASQYDLEGRELGPRSV